MILFSCGEISKEKTTSDLNNLTFSLDTVMVDSGEDFINLKYGIWGSAISQDHKYLYNWNQETAEPDKINLNQLILEGKIKFEKEGPNGVGSYISWISLLRSDQVVFANFQDIG